MCGRYVGLRRHAHIDRSSCGCMLLSAVFASITFALYLAHRGQSAHAAPFRTPAGMTVAACASVFAGKAFDMRASSHYNYLVEPSPAGIAIVNREQEVCLTPVADAESANARAMHMSSEEMSCVQACQLSYEAMHSSCAARGEPGGLWNVRFLPIDGGPGALLAVRLIQGIDEGMMVFERRFTYTSCANRESQTISVEIGTPYFPAKTAGMEMLYACPYQIDAASSITEALGIDHLQALGGALSIVHLYLSDLSAQGQLRWPDGRLYDYERDCPITFDNSPGPSVSRRHEDGAGGILQDHSCSSRGGK